MPQGLIMEFEGSGREDYEMANRQMGIEPDADHTNWPVGLLFHAAGATSGGWVVFEVWESADSQQLFTEDRLSPAAQAVGFPGPPSRVEWIDLAALWPSAHDGS